MLWVASQVVVLQLCWRLLPDYDSHIVIISQGTIRGRSASLPILIRMHSRYYSLPFSLSPLPALCLVHSLIALGFVSTFSHSVFSAYPLSEVTLGPIIIIASTEKDERKEQKMKGTNCVMLYKMLFICSYLFIVYRMYILDI